MDQDRIKYLLGQYIAGKATGEEYDQLFDALNKEEHSGEIELLLQEFAAEQPPDASYNPSRWESVITKILQKDHRVAVVKRSKWRMLYRAAAAVAVLVLGLTLWISSRHAQPSSPVYTETANSFSNDVLPGSNRAMLTLANGRTIPLDSTERDTIVQQGNTKVLKLNSGLLAYHSTNNQPADVVYNMLTTPRGGQYKVVLPDGSKVWLNSASSLYFPTSFPGKERAVSITGEAYFEIAGDAAKPFIVSTGGMKIKVLGTHFNVMAYPREPFIKTTLLEGAVKIIAGNEAALLAPGQQANLDRSGKIQLVKNVDMEEAVAWKNGLFDFEDADIEGIMRQIARWYDVEIVYAGEIPPGHITGKIPRATNLSNVLKMLELSGVHFKMENKKLIVLPH